MCNLLDGLVALCYEGCEGHGSANGLPQPRMELAERRPIWAGIVDGAKLLKPFNNNNNNRRLVTLAEHTSDHGKQTNSSTKAKGEQG